MGQIEIRKAGKEDAALVAWAVLTALDLDTDNLARVGAVCADDTTLYSWRNSLVALVDGQPAGCLVGYDGARYMEMRERTWPAMWDDVSADYLDNIAIETQSGEFYLDSMAIRREFRGLNIGKMLINRMIELHVADGYRVFTLIVDVTKPHLHSYYESIGFRDMSDIRFFEHTYKKMVRRVEPLSF